MPSSNWSKPTTGGGKPHDQSRGRFQCLGAARPRISRKETLQIRRDASSFLIAGVLPLLLLFIFGYGVTLDLRRVPVAMVIEQSTPETDSMLASFRNSPYFRVVLARDRREVEEDLVSGRVKGVVVLAADFSDRLGRGDSAPVQIIVDGSDPNTAGLVMNYVQGVWVNWLEQEAVSRNAVLSRPGLSPVVLIEPRYWFNPDVRSQNFLIPGSVAIILTLIGTLLTALVVAREWERGTIEALMATPVGRAEFLLGKLIPYFLLGMTAMVLSVTAAVFVFNVPFRGSILALLIVSSTFLVTMLCLGLLISTLAKNQFAASQAALLAAFLPAFELSGFYLRDRRHAVAHPFHHALSAAALLRGQLADPVSVGRRDERAGAKHVGHRRDRRGAVYAVGAHHAHAFGVIAMWQRVLTLIIKEFLAIWRDPRSRAILIVPPMLQLTVFAFAATQEVKDVRIAILNRDLGNAGRDLVELFEGAWNFSDIRFLDNESQIAEVIDSRAALMVLDIQSDFSRKLESRQPAVVQLLLDGRRSNAAQIVEGYAGAIVGRFNDELRTGTRAPPPATVVVSRIWFNENLTTTWNTVPSLVAVLSTLMGLVVTALSVARERELGTFEQLLVSPLSPFEIIIGKTVPALLIGIVQASGMMLLGVFGFRVPFHGSLLLLYGAMVVYLCAVIGVGLFVSSLAKTQQQAILGGFVFMVPAMLLSGFASPIENMPDWLQYVTLANPIRYFIVIVKGIFLKDAAAWIVAENVWPMALIAVVTLSSATWLFRHRMG